MAGKNSNISKFIISLALSNILLLVFLTVLIFFFNNDIKNSFIDFSFKIISQKNHTIAEKHISNIYKDHILNKTDIEQYLSELNNDNILSSVIFSSTSDENFFRVRKIYYYQDGFSFPFKKGEKISDSEKNNYIKSGINNITTDHEIHKTGSYYWQNIYFPIKNGSKINVIQLTVSASYLNHVLKSFMTKLRSFRIKSTVVLISFAFIIFSISLLYIHNLTLFINSLTSVIHRAASGKTDIKMNENIDTDFENLAVSLNSLIGGIKEKDKIIGEMNGKIDTDNLFKKGVNLLKENRLENAACLFEIILEMKPDSFGINFNLGVINAKNKNYQDALIFFEKAQKANPEYEMTEKYIQKVRKKLQ